MRRISAVMMLLTTSSLAQQPPAAPQQNPADDTKAIAMQEVRPTGEDRLRLDAAVAKQEAADAYVMLVVTQIINKNPGWKWDPQEKRFFTVMPVPGGPGQAQPRATPQTPPKK